MRWIIRGFVLIVLLVVLAIGAVLLIPSKKVADMAARQFLAATGRTLTLSGKVSPTLWPRLGVRTGAVEIANAKWAKDGPMLAAKGLDIGIDPIALLQGDIKISKVEVLSPRILLERRKDGEGNWQFTPPAGAQASAAGGTASSTATTSEGGGGIQAFSLDKGIITDGSVTWIDHATGQRIALSKIDATLKIPQFNGAATLDMTAVANGKPLKLSGTLGEFAAFLQGKVVASDLKAEIGPSSIGFKGKIGTDPVAAQGHLAADLKDPSALAAILGVSVPSLPQGLGRRLIAVTGDATLTPKGSIHLRGGAVTLDDNKMKLAADVTFPKGQPTFNAQIEAGALNLSGLTAQASGAPAGAAGKGQSAGWSTAPIDASGLNAINGELSLSASSINLGVAKLGKTQAMVKLDNGRAVVDLRQLAAYGGGVTGQLVVNGRGGLSVSTDLTAKGVEMRPLLTDLAGYKRLDAAADMTLKLAASGDSEAALARSLSGSGKVSFGKGELQGLDLLGMLRTLNLNYVGQGAKTIFDSIGASFTINKGVLSNNDLSLKAPLLTAAGRGTVNIGARTLDYTVTPTAMPKADGTGALTVPVHFSGPWARPKFALDVNGIRGGKIDQAKQDLEKKLGIDPQNGQSTKDAVKQKLEEQAKKGLLKLFKQ